MSTLKVNNLQVGQDSTATNNLTWFQPGSPDGTIRLGSGNAGSATSKFTFDKDGNLTCVGNINAASILAPIEGTLDDWIVHAGDTNTKFGFSAADTFQVQTAGTEAITVNSSQKVGIGITAPLHNLHIKPATAAETVLKIEAESGYDARLKLDTSSGGGAEARIDFEEDASIRGWISYTNNSGGTTDDMVFGTATSERLRIGATGLHSITATTYEALKITTNANGNNGPEVQLIHNSASPAANDCIGQLRFSGKDSAGNTDLMSRIETIIGSPTSGQETAHLNFATRGLGAFNTIFRLNARSSASAPSYTTDDMNGIILDTYNGGGGSGYPRYFSLIAKSAGNTDSNLSFWTEAVGGSPTEKLRISSAGLIQAKTRAAEVRRMILSGSPSNAAFNIEAHDGETGTSSGDVQGKLGLFYNDGSTLTNTACISFERGSGAADGAMSFVTNQGESFRIDSSKRVLIGGGSNSASSHADELQVINTSAEGGISIINGTSSMGHIYFGDSGGAAQGRIDYNHGGDYMRFYSNNKERFRIDSDGRVIVGGGAHAGGGALVVKGDGETPNAYGCASFCRIGANPTSGTTLTNLRFSGGSGGTSRAAEINVKCDANWSEGSSHASKMELGVVDSGGTGISGPSLTLKAGGDVEINRGDLVMASGKGINFAADPNNSGRDHDTLDDYEEGDWTPTPVITHQGGSGSFSSISNQKGRYVKIGHMVQVWFYMRFTGSNITNCNVGVSGLPFTISNDGQWSNFTAGVARRGVIGGETYVCENLIKNTTQINVLRKYNNTGFSDADQSITGVAHYLVD